jgi:Fe-S-cluster containining protein
MAVMKFGKNKIPWYSAGLRFECLQCGHCCAGPEQGYIWISRPEIRLIADFLKMPVKELKQKFMRRIGLRMTIVEDPHTHDCVFLRQTKERKSCAIYKVRPAQCRNWPFWDWNLENLDAWNSAGAQCPGMNRGIFYSPEQIRDKMKNKKWPAFRSIRRSVRGVASPSGATEDGESKSKVISRVSVIYNWIDEQILANETIAGNCLTCGKCCDFESYDHRLYVTAPEMIYFVNKIGDAKIKQMTSGRCCYQVDGKCSVHAHRFAGCRIFCCKGNAAFQSELTESAIKKFKALCAELNIPYRYVELSAALKDAYTSRHIFVPLRQQSHLSLQGMN